MTDAAWTPADIARLTELWATGQTSAAIAAAMGRSKNAVLGKAHRLKLASRPNPIKGGRPKGATQKAPREPRVKTVTRKPLPKPVAPQVAGVPDVGGRLGCCQYVVGEPRGAATLYCGAPTEGASAWCQAHRPFVYSGRAVA